MAICAVSKGRRKASGWIDSMSLTQVVQAFDVGLDNTGPFQGCIPAEVTALLIFAQNIGLAPGLSRSGISSKGPVGLVTDQLMRSGILTGPELDEQSRTQSLEQTKTQIEQYYDNLKEYYHKFSERDEVKRWMDWSIRSAWVEHAQNSGSLIDRGLIPQLATMLNTSENELTRLEELTRSPEVVRRYVKQQPNTDDFNMVYDCFLLGALLRGLYHYHLGMQIKQQVVPHPFREELLPKTPADPLLYGETNVEGYLTNIVLWSALSRRGTQARLNRWADNIRKLRHASSPGHEVIDLSQKEDAKLAKQAAINAAKKLEIDVHPWWLEEVVDGAVAAGVIAGGAVLNPFVGVGIGSLEYLLSRTIHMGEATGRAIYAQPSRLSRLAEAPPGHISWENKVSRP